METKDIVAIVISVIFAVGAIYGLWVSRNNDSSKPGE